MSADENSPLPASTERRRTVSADGASPLTHPRESHLLPLVERLVEAHERGVDRGGGRAHGGKPLPHRGQAAARGERGLGGASGCGAGGGVLGMGGPGARTGARTGGSTAAGRALYAPRPRA